MLQPHRETRKLDLKESLSGHWLEKSFINAVDLPFIYHLLTWTCIGNLEDVVVVSFRWLLVHCGNLF